MSFSSSSSSVPTKNASTNERCRSASQVAKDVHSFEEWQVFQNCEEVLSFDMPETIRAHTSMVFKLDGQLPHVWIEGKKTKIGRSLARIVEPEFLAFLTTAEETVPGLFSEHVPHDAESVGVLRDLQNIFTAWKSARQMRESTRQWSEADYATGVYNHVRRASIRLSEPRAQCTIALPHPVSRHKVTPDVVRILNGKTAKPDGALFLPTRLLVKELCERKDSPYNILHRNSKTKQRSGAANRESSFRYQSTICAKLPDACVFEIASAFWEDKKPCQNVLGAAYRQNRMATTAALRQLHALDVAAPIFGLVWAEGSVRAHADWWDVNTEDSEKVLKIYSAPYGGPSQVGRRESCPFHQWNLAEPADIIQVYLLMRNLDHWTAGAFRDAVITGITGLAQRVEAGEAHAVAWRRKGDITVSKARKAPRAPAAPEPELLVQVTVKVEDPAPAKRKTKGKSKMRITTPRTSIGSVH
ncbi:hypothetical protein C2E23DRAFT_803173 [Lenzites betulinus]|nr:hypothetical protein C2E23DRAFT_803173 [Lenzites betulinus]